MMLIPSITNVQKFENLILRFHYIGTFTTIAKAGLNLPPPTYSSTTISTASTTATNSSNNLNPFQYKDISANDVVKVSRNAVQQETCMDSNPRKELMKRPKEDNLNNPKKQKMKEYKGIPVRELQYSEEKMNVEIEYFEIAIDQVNIPEDRIEYYFDEEIKKDEKGIKVEEEEEQDEGIEIGPVEEMNFEDHENTSEVINKKKLDEELI